MYDDVVGAGACAIAEIYNSFDAAVILDMHGKLSEKIQKSFFLGASDYANRLRTLN